MEGEIAIVIQYAGVKTLRFFQQRAREDQPHCDHHARIKKKVNKGPSIRLGTRATDGLYCPSDIRIDDCAALLAHEEQQRHRQNQLGQADGNFAEAEKGSEDETNKAHQSETDAGAAAETRSERSVPVIGVGEKRAAHDGDEG